MISIIGELVFCLVTLLGVFYAGKQLLLSKNLAQAQFEDSINKEYRELMKDVPAEILMGKKFEENADEKKRREAKECIYNYIDLSNEQVFLRMNHRVSDKTWVFWCDGIKHNLQLPEFNTVWTEIKECSPENFTELRKLESGFVTDPKDWEN